MLQFLLGKAIYQDFKIVSVDDTSVPPFVEVLF